MGTAKKLRIAYHFARSGSAERDTFDCGHCRLKGHWQKRNCRAYHADEFVQLRVAANGEFEMKRKFPAKEVDVEVWRPRYEVKSKDKTTAFTIPSIRLYECPVGFVTPYSKYLLAQITRSQNAHESTGASLFGPDLSRWPIEFYDALTIINAESAEADAQRSKAVGA